MYKVGSEWTNEEISTAANMWAAGQSAAKIATALGRSRSAVLGAMSRNRSAFPKRSKSENTKRSQTVTSRQTNPINVVAIRKARQAASAPTKIERVPSPAPQPVGHIVEQDPIWAESIEAGVRSDLSRFRLADHEPKPFASLGNQECRFPLVCFEVVGGPDMPCCGASTDPLASYCNAHRTVMAGRL